MHRAIVCVMLFAAAPLIACAQEGDTAATRSIPGNAPDAIATITGDDIMQRIGILAHDSMGGRDTPSAELDQAAEWVASEFARFGLRPAGDDGTFVQRYPLVRRRPDISATGLQFDGEPRWRLGDDLLIYSGTTPADGVAAPVTVLSGQPTVRALAEADLSGRVAVWIVPSTPGGPDFGAVNRFVPDMLEHSPAAVVLVTDRSSAQWSVSTATLRQTRLETNWDAAGASPPILEIRDRSIEQVLRAQGIDVRAARRAGFRVRPLERTATVVARYAEERLGAPNVVAIVPGSDAALRNEYVAYSAHLDHVGRAGPENPRCTALAGDDICNGADDDASGVATVLEIAEAMASLDPAPRRSVLFLIVSGEERGLWGSQYFTEHPTVPLENVVANLNADMVGRNWRDTIVAIGKEHSDLGATLNQVNAAHPELDMTAIDDIWPEENFYFRSDHFNFARRGVPILFFFNGTHREYHRPDDEVELIDGEKTARIAKLLWYLGVEIANRTERPEWNRASYRRIVER